MTDKTTKNSASQKDTESEPKGGKIWLRDDGIIQIKVYKKLNKEVVERLLRGFQETARGLPIKPKILADISSGPLAPGSLFRKKIVGLIKDVAKDPGFEKIALWGGGITQRTALSFILSVVRLKNIKYFKAEEEAIKWLKEE